MDVITNWLTDLILLAQIYRITLLGTSFSYVVRLTCCALSSSRVGDPASINCTHCCYISSWDILRVTSEHNLSSLSCVVISFNETISRGSSSTTVDWGEKYHALWQLYWGIANRVISMMKCTLECNGMYIYYAFAQLFSFYILSPKFSSQKKYEHCKICKKNLWMREYK